MTRLRFLVLSAIGAIWPLRKRYTLDAWMAQDGVTIQFQHRPPRPDIPARSTAILDISGFNGSAYFLSCTDIDPAEFERLIRQQLLGTTKQFYKWEPSLIVHPSETWNDVEISPAPFRKTLVKEVYFPTDLIV